MFGEISGGCLRWLNEWCGIFDEIVMVIGDESSFRRGVLLATNENDVPFTFKPADIDSWEPGLPSDYERNSAGSSAKNFGDAINRFVINPNRIFRVMDSSRYSRRRSYFKIKDMTQIDNMQYKGSSRPSGKRPDR
jgi:hypothetical protein